MASLGVGSATDTRPASGPRQRTAPAAPSDAHASSLCGFARAWLGPSESRCSVIATSQEAVAT